MTNDSFLFRASRFAAACILALTLYVPNARAAAPSGTPSATDIEDIAARGYIYGLPLVMHYAITYAYAVDRDSGQYKAPFNTIRNGTQVFTYKDTAVITPNSDTPYSFACLDLRAEPMVLGVPRVPDGRYFSVQLIDANTFNFGYIGSRTTGNNGGSFLVAGPDWNGTPPAGMRVFRAGTRFAMAMYRTQLLNPADMKNVRNIQAGYTVRPLSAFLGKPTPPSPPLPHFPHIGQDYLTPEFFDWLAFALQFAPAGPEEKDIRAQLERIGVRAGRPFRFNALPQESQAALLRGMRKGEAQIDGIINRPGVRVNGWKIGSPFGDRAYFNGNWMLRAIGAKAGIYGNDAAEAVYPMTRTLPDGTPLDGSRHNYKITFPAGQYPPVRAFWSITMYHGGTQLLIKNPINRYLVNNSMLPDMRKNPDGSLTIFIQRRSPGKALESNWLPAPDGPIYLVMRLYWPRTDPPSVLPPGKGTWQPPRVELNE